MSELSYELLRGMAYRKIRHANAKIYTTWLPGIVWAIVIASYLAVPEKPSLLGKEGALAAALSVISTLPGFYFAGLAAVATFGGNSMDREMPSPAPELNILISGQWVMVKLTRRQFLSYLFSYLVIISFALCLIIVALIFLGPSIDYAREAISGIRFGDQIWFLGKLFSVMVIASLFSSMIVTTLHGVFFLTEKIHQP